MNTAVEFNNIRVRFTVARFCRQLLPTVTTFIANWLQKCQLSEP